MSTCSGSACQHAKVVLAVPVPFGHLAVLGGVAVVALLVVVGVGVSFLRMSTNLDEMRAS